MSTKVPIDVPELGDSSKFAYLHCATAGGLVFVAGQTGVNAEYEIVSPHFGLQARRALENVRTALRATGSDLADIVNMTVYLVDIRDSPEFMRICREVMGDDLAPSTVVGGVDLALPGLLVEVQVTAAQRP